jgi:hypothetical protein
MTKRIEGQLQGYRLRNEVYEPVTDGRSEPLQLRLAVEGALISFYREDTGEKLLIPSELAERLLEESKARQQAEARVERLAQYLRAQGIDPESI